MTKGINVDKLPTFDIEYFFLNIRAKSIGESIKIVVTCADDGETEVPVTIFVDEIKVEKHPDHNIDISLGNKTLRMKYPSLTEFVESNFEINNNETLEEQVDRSFKPIASCLDMLYTDDEAWDFSSYTEREKIEFIGKLTSKQYKDVDKFFNTMPKLYHELEVENPNTGVKNRVVLEGLKDFFA